MRLLVRMYEVVEVLVPAGTYESAEEASLDDNFHERLGSPLRLVEHEDHEVITDPDEIERYEDRARWRMEVTHVG